MTLEALRWQDRKMGTLIGGGSAKSFAERLESAAKDSRLEREPDLQREHLEPPEYFAVNPVTLESNRFAEF